MPVRPLNVFLLRVVPWPTASQPGYVNVHWMQPGLSGPAGRPFTEHVNACRFTFGMAQPQHQRDLYVCMSLQARHGGPAKSGKLKALRDEDGVVAIKALYADVDLWKPADGPDSKKYRTTEEAFAAFRAWRDKTGMPLPTFVVMSGSGGFHAHWVFDEAMPVAVWEPLARALVNAGQTEGFVFDYKITTNPVCILRIPETYNHKTNPPHPVILAHPDLAAGATPVEYPVALLDKVLTPYKVSLRPGVTRQIPSNLGRISPVFAGHLPTGRLDAGLDTYQPTLEDVIDGGCQWLDALKQTGGAQRGENEWFESLKVAYYLKDGLQVAHELSEDHATYSEQDTDNKFAAIEHSHGGGRLGWPQCRTIHDAGAGECRSCQHFKKGRSPLNFAIPKTVVAVAAAAAIAVSPTPSMSAPLHPEWLPTPYKHDRERKIYQDIPDPADENRMVRSYVLPLPMFNFSPYDKTDNVGQYMLGFDVELRPSMVRQVAVSYDQIMDLRDLGRQLGGVHGVPALPNELQSVRKFGVSYLQQLRDAKDRVAVHSSAPFGWMKRDGKIVGFVYGRKLHNGKDPVPVQPLVPKIDADYSPTGDLSVWKDVVKLITDQKRPELVVPIYASMGSPLVMPTGVNGGCLHLHGESGAGKSNALLGAQTVWGTPKRMNILGDTLIGIDTKLGQLHVLPEIYDEVRKTMNRDLADLFMRIGQGQSKQRATRSGTDLAENFSWHTIMISASNPTMHAYISEVDPTTIAAINRVFEYPVEQNKSGTGMLMTGSEAGRAFGLLRDNYGVAGLELAKFYGANYDLVSNMIARITDGVDRRGQCGPDDRFYVTIVGASLGGGLIGNKLNLIDTDMDQAEGFLIETLQDLRLQRRGATNNFSNRESVERHIADFVADNRNRMLRTDEVWLSNHKPPNTWHARVLNDYALKDEKIVAREAVKNRVLRLSVPALNAWLKKERGFSFSDLKDPIMRLVPRARVSKWDLGHGTERYKSSRILVLEITEPQFWEFN